MISKSLPFLMVLLFALRPACRAQDGEGTSAVKVDITRYADGSYSATRTDPDAHTSESFTYTSQGRLVKITAYEFDDSGKASGASVYAPKGDAKGALLYKMRYKYDAMNRVGEVDNYSADDQLQSRQVYHYDNAGKVSKVETYDAAGNLINSSASSAAIPDPKRGFSPNH